MTRYRLHSTKNQGDRGAAGSGCNVMLEHGTCGTLNKLSMHGALVRCTTTAVVLKKTPSGGMSYASTAVCTADYKQ